MNVRLEEKNRMIHFLNERGVDTYIDDDGDLVLRKDGTNFWIVFDFDDQNRRQLVLPGVDLFKNETDSARGCKTALQIVRGIKDVKAFLQGDSLLCFAVELTSPDFETLTRDLERSLEACLFATRLYWLERGEQTAVKAVALLRARRDRSETF